ncbi:MAG: hybrid sensor histidine kinase/response regulator, partial [Bacteroides sp.]|nr:hybrid sensor histidine kinase/response regulator [Bacteroides sp.]
MKFKTLLIQIIFFFCTLCVWGGRPMYSFHHSWEVNDGISQLSVVTICQDSRGYLWLGTRNGLNRYNGTGYTIFRHRPGDSLTIVDNSINKICEDHDNNLWIATVRGVSKMCLFTERIRNYSIADGLPDEGILSTLVDKSGRVWLGTRTGLCRYIPEK